MDSSTINDLYLGFRSKLLGPAYTLDEVFGSLKKFVMPLAKEANIGYIHCTYFAPISQFSPNGLTGDITVYHNKERLPEIPTSAAFSETLTTGEQGAYTFLAHPVEGHAFSETEKQIVQLLSWDFFILGGRARLMGNTRKAAITDPLTGASNQGGIFAHCQQVIGNTLRDYTAFFINLKNFKYVNKSFGSQIGDLALKIFVQQILLVLDEKELVARLGGDNFFVLVKKPNQENFISKFKTLEIQINQGPKPLSIQLQCRMGVYPIEDSADIGDALNSAATAMQASKAIKTQDIIYCTNEMIARAMHQREISAEFHSALRNREFVAFYQPKVDLTTRKLCGAEALVRWIRHKTIVPPLDFIPVLEREGTICDLDFYILDMVCADIRQWIDMGLTPPRISTNFSKHHLKSPDLAERILATMHKYNISHDLIEIELTEVSDYDDSVAMRHFVNTMFENGVAISIDDFGTGYSTLNVLKDYNITTVKLDKSLLNNIGNPNSKDEIVIRNVVNMANELQKEVIAEGVETETQAEYLKSINCNMVQGFLFDRPLLHDEFQKCLTGEHTY